MTGKMEPDRARQLILEQAIIGEINKVRAVMRSFKNEYDSWDPDEWDPMEDSDEAKPRTVSLDPEEIKKRIEKAELVLVTSLTQLLQSVTLSYGGNAGVKEGFLDMEKNEVTGWRVEGEEVKG